MIAAALAGLLLQAGVADLGWMSGRWEATGAGDRWTEEVWSAPRGGVMLGYSRTGRGEAVREWEFIRVQAGADGVPVYWGAPGGRPAVGFRLTARDAASATFENPGHDFPQRIRYVREGDTMTATVSAIDGSNAISWTYRRQ